MEMACNENIIKNMANEVTRNVKDKNIYVEPEFVMYLIELLLLNPKYGKLFTKSLNRNTLEYFVQECAGMIERGGTPINTLKMQFIMRTNYDKVDVLVAKHEDSIKNCLTPLLDEILDEEEVVESEAHLKKIYRKIAIYIIMATGLGNPASFIILKEGMAALESIFTLDDLKSFLTLSPRKRHKQLEALMKICAGVRLFNRDCKKGGEGIQDLPFDVVDAGKACLLSLSHSLINVMQKVNTLTTAIEDQVVLDDEHKNVTIDVPSDSGLTVESYKDIFALLLFYRQYEIFIRRLLCDLEVIVATAKQLVQDYKVALEELHNAVKYKEAVPQDTVFPLFIQLWVIWKEMQNTMYLVSTVNRLMVTLNGIQEHSKLPVPIIEKMLKGKTVTSDEVRMSTDTQAYSTSEADMVSLHTFASITQSLAENVISASALRERHISFLGFCVMCLNVGALVPSNLKVGVIIHGKGRYGFSNLKMAVRFKKNPDRYINEVIQYARDHVEIISLLKIKEMVEKVRDIDDIVERIVPKTVVAEKEIQTLLHPIEENIDRNYTWDLWEWKRRACQWATIVNCRTHSTQTKYSHWRSEIHCQTFAPRDKGDQTMKSEGINTNRCDYFIWGLRGQIGSGQHTMNLVPPHSSDKPKAKPVVKCGWPCTVGAKDASADTSGSSTERQLEFYDSERKMTSFEDEA